MRIARAFVLLTGVLLSLLLLDCGGSDQVKTPTSFDGELDSSFAGATVLVLTTNSPAKVIGKALVDSQGKFNIPANQDSAKTYLSIVPKTGSPILVQFKSKKDAVGKVVIKKDEGPIKLGKISIENGVASVKLPAERENLVSPTDNPKDDNVDGVLQAIKQEFPDRVDSFGCSVLSTEPKEGDEILSGPLTISFVAAVDKGSFENGFRLTGPGGGVSDLKFSYDGLNAVVTLEDKLPAGNYTIIIPSSVECGTAALKSEFKSNFTVKVASVATTTTTTTTAKALLQKLAWPKIIEQNEEEAVVLLDRIKGSAIAGINKQMENTEIQNKNFSYSRPENIFFIGSDYPAEMALRYMIIQDDIAAMKDRSPFLIAKTKEAIKALKSLGVSGSFVYTKKEIESIDQLMSAHAASRGTGDSTTSISDAINVAMEIRAREDSQKALTITLGANIQYPLNGARRDIAAYLDSNVSEGRFIAWAADKVQAKNFYIKLKTSDDTAGINTPAVPWRDAEEIKKNNAFIKAHKIVSSDPYFNDFITNYDQKLRENCLQGRCDDNVVLNISSALRNSPKLDKFLESLKGTVVDSYTFSTHGVSQPTVTLTLKK